MNWLTAVTSGKNRMERGLLAFQPLGGVTSRLRGPGYNLPQMDLCLQTQPEFWIWLSDLTFPNHIVSYKSNILSGIHNQSIDEIILT